MFIKPELHKVEPVIRQATALDIPSITELIDVGCLEGCLTPKLINSETVKDFIVCELEEIVACGCLEVYTDRLAEIRSLYVRIPYRKNGIGDSLIRELMIRANEKGIQRVIAITNKGGQFKKFGFDNEGIVMYKRL